MRRIGGSQLHCNAFTRGVRGEHCWHSSHDCLILAWLICPSEALGSTLLTWLLNLNIYVLVVPPSVHPSSSPPSPHLLFFSLFVWWISSEGFGVTRGIDLGETVPESVYLAFLLAKPDKRREPWWIAHSSPVIGFSVSSAMWATVEGCELLLCQIPHLLRAVGLGREVKTSTPAWAHEWYISFPFDTF